MGDRKLSRSEALRLSDDKYTRSLSVNAIQRLAAMSVQGPSNDADSDK